MTSVLPGLRRPPALRPGDRVHVISPSGPVTPKLLAPGVEVLTRWGLEVIIDDRVYRRRPPYDYLAGDDSARAAAFHQAWFDPQCRGIICSRGGYGAMRLLPHLDLRALAECPRLVLGFSDITALHLFLCRPGGLTSLHGPVVKSLGRHLHDPHQNLARLKSALFATTQTPEPWTDLHTLRPGRARGPVIGGNLSVLVAMLATTYGPCLDGAILVVEDVGEDDYRVDRLLTALRLNHSGSIAGLVLGDFTDCDGVYVSPEEISAYLASLAADFDCPVVAGAPLGHEDRNVAFPMGAFAELDADAGTLRFETHAASPNRE